MQKRVKHLDQLGLAPIKIIIIAALVLLVGIVGYFTFSGSTDSTIPANEQSEDLKDDSGGSINDADSSNERPQSEDSGRLNNNDSATTEKVNNMSYTIDAFNFGYSLSEMKVNPGDTVTVTLNSTGGSHDWVIDEIAGASTKIISPGQSTSVTFTVPESAAGNTYEFYCSVGSHRAQGMVGKFVISG